MIYNTGCTGIANGGLVASHFAYRPIDFVAPSTIVNTCTHNILYARDSAIRTTCSDFMSDISSCYNDKNCIFNPTLATVVSDTTTCPLGGVKISTNTVID